VRKAFEPSPYQATTSQDGGWEIGAAELTQIAAQALDPICSQMRSKGIRPAAVGIDTFWHSILGVSAADKAITPVLHQSIDLKAMDLSLGIGFADKGGDGKGGGDGASPGCNSNWASSWIRKRRMSTFSWSIRRKRRHMRI
jgi:sugar (pentulose or hexulose) kinase